MTRFLAIFLCSLVAVSHCFTIQPRILNGFTSNPSDFPFYTFIDFPDSECGGSLISDEWVITAAHCLNLTESATVSVGMNGNGHFSEEVTVEAKHQYIHPGYSDDRVNNDIGLMRLSWPITFSNWTQQAKLPADCRSLRKGNESVIAIGAGYYAMEAAAEANEDIVLRHAYFKTLSSHECGQSMELSQTKSIICTNVANNQSAYNGDSGGPLISAIDGTLIGIMNFVKEAADDSITDVHARCVAQAYANIRYHYKWISQITGLKLPQCRRTMRDEFIFSHPQVAAMFNMRLDDYD